MMRMSTYDVIIAGGGSAGLSAALVLGRARRTVLVADDGQPRNGAVDFSHGYLTRDGTPPAEMRRIALAEIARYPSVTLIDARVIGATAADDGFTVAFADSTTATCARFILATGVFDALPEIAGLRERWGRSIFVCPFCDGWELQDHTIAVIGANRDAVGLAQEIAGWTNDVIICAERDDFTDDDRRWIEAFGARLHIGSIREFAGAGSSLDRIVFADGRSVACDAAFISAPLRQHSPLVHALGCELTDAGSVRVTSEYETTVPGCYAAGDDVTGVHQIIVAAASGARAAIAITTSLLSAEAARITEPPVTPAVDAVAASAR